VIRRTYANSVNNLPFEGIETARHALRAAQFNAARAAEGFPVDEDLVTPGTLYFCGRSRRIVIKA
jgi:hypothetical protein